MKNHKNLFLRRWPKTKGKTRRNKENEDNIELFDNKKSDEMRGKMDVEKKIERLPLSRIAEMLQQDSEKEIEDYKKLSGYIEKVFYEREGLIMELKDEYNNHVRMLHDYDMMNKKLESKTAECERLKSYIRLLNKEMNDEG